ncbi:calcium-binding protein [Alicycliphilus denitrificans]|uniref:calcium-binding protein n=1 Tax=Alicycliphilus denitrificans TaxID=179636 RepID=UPI001F2D473F|nr:calcium-binding protein [Alicycliphilus denitrificans]
MELSVEEYNKLMDYISKSIENPPPYYLPYGSQCATWAMKGLIEAGIPAIVSPNMWPDSLLDDLLETIIWNPYTQYLSIQINELFQQARTWQPPRDPLVLDLDGDGIETVGITGSNPILFDHDADGTRTGTGWIKPDDGFVVLDLNGNGRIDSGREMFGDQTLRSGPPAQIGASPFHANGYAALAAYDTNGDGAINPQDAIYGQLRVWRDLNQDGVSQANELQTLGQLGVASIGVAGTQANVDLGGGNSMPLSGSFSRTDGSTGTSGIAELSGSLLLASNNFYRDFSDDPPLSQAALALPQMGGSGWVRDLREAMSTTAGAELLTQVQAFAAASTRDAQLAVLDDLLLEWANSSGMKLNEIGTYELHQDEQGNYTTGVTGGGTGRRAFVTLNPEGMVQTAGGAGSGGAGSSSGGGGGSGVSSGNGDELTPEGVRLFQRLNILEVFNGLRFIEIPPRGDDGLPQGAPSTGSGGSGGSGGVDDGTIRFSGPLSQAQVDLLTQSYELLRKSVYEALVLQTRLRPYLDAIQIVVDESGIHFDTTQLTALLNQAQSSDARNGLIDLIELNKYAQGTLQAVGFDGLGLLRQNIGSLTGSELEALGVYQSGAGGSAGGGIYLGDASGNSYQGGTGDDILDGGDGMDYLSGGQGDDQLLGGDGDDVLSGDEDDDRLDGGAGNDRLYGGAGSDVLLGGDGDDILYAAGQYGGGSAGAVDILDGGAGNDQLVGGFGSQTYLFGRGDGQDAINNCTDAWNGSADPTVGKQDVLQFKAGIQAGDVSLSRDGDNLILKINGSTDQVTVQSYFSADGLSPQGYALDLIRFDDGTGWDLAQVKVMVQQGTDGNDTLYGYADGGTLSGGLDDDILYGYGGNDRLEGGAGSDSLYGGLGNDTYLFGRDSGADTISDYDTTAGNTDVLSIGEGVSADQLWFRRVGSNLEVSIIGTLDKSTISNWYSGSEYHIEQFKTADGKLLLSSQMASLVDAMAAFAPPPAGETTLAANYQAALTPVLAAGWN